MTQADSVHSTPPINTSAINESQSPAKPPEEAQVSLYLPTDVSPEEVFQAIGRLRKEARDEIDRLIRFLDDTDNHMELDQAVDDVGCDAPDEGNDEPSLGWTEQEARWGRHAWSGFIDAELDPVDDEPSLGALPDVDQTKWEKAGGDDREGDGCADDREGDELQHGGDEHDGAEPDEPEPSLGWPERVNQAGDPGGFMDMEEGVGARRPQGGTSIDRPAITAVNTYRRFLGGLSAEQKAAVRKRMRPDAKVSLT
jgi:hypothetical protein